MVWRWDGSKFRSLTTSATPVQESEGGFPIASSGAQASLMVSVAGASLQSYVIVGSSLGNTDSHLYIVREDEVTGKRLHALASVQASSNLVICWLCKILSDQEQSNSRRMDRKFTLHSTDLAVFLYSKSETRCHIQVISHYFKRYCGAYARLQVEQ